LSINWVIVGGILGIITGGGGLYLAFSEEFLSTDVLPPIKKLKSQLEAITAEVNSLTNENNEITKMYAELEEENKKTLSELAKTIEEKTQLHKYSQDLLAEKNRVVEEKEQLHQYSLVLLAEKNETMTQLSESQLEASKYKTHLISVEEKTIEIENVLKQQTENSTSIEKRLTDYFDYVKSWKQK
jgi:chromosome segregation ATPase